MATRPAEEAVTPDLALRALSRLCGVRGVVRQHLGPLRPGEVAEVLTQVYAGTRPSGRLVTSLWRRTGGNPFALTELLAAHAGQPLEALLRPAPLRPAVVPRTAVVPRPAGRRTSPRAADPSGPDGAELTGREIEVLGCLVAGMSNKQVAKALGISVRTVTVHVSNLLRKTGAASRTEVALWAVRHRLPVTAPVDG
ncbi:helix-turn-helix transcriptional regulator [Micromonospora globbae]|uniref:helix-turn-helix transcriptional regulator n=1 Tax=Micromonospora globbae TaxID=1894969 RepID=UPI001F010010|nr:response regulator transcription factor [Micromonospora globbae]